LELDAETPGVKHPVFSEEELITNVYGDAREAV
jgi:hypothetical protein